MKQIITTLTLLLLLTACGNKKKNDTTTPLDISIENGQTAVLYFHSNHRCATCMAVENTTKEAIEENYKDEVPFYSIDITTSEAKALMQQYNIAVQTLLIVKDDKRENITSHAFMYARSKPEKVKENITSILESL